MKRLISVFLGLSLLLTACGKSDGGVSAPPTSSEASREAVSEEPADPYAARTYPLIDWEGYWRISGRTLSVMDTNGNYGMMFDHAAQGLFFTADCEGDVTLTLSLRVGDKDKYADTRYYTLYLDGVRQEERLAVTGVALTETKQTLTLATGLEKDVHEFALYRQSAFSAGWDNLISLSMTGTLKKWEKEIPYRIEFLGDSITVGWGNLVPHGTSPDNKGSPFYSDATQTYAFFACEELGAEISTVAQGGCHYIPKDPNINTYFPVYSPCRPQKTAYDFAQNPVDMVVISLGTNDDAWSYLKPEERIGYGVDLLQSVRDAYPEAKIVWSYGQMSVACAALMAETVRRAGGADNGFYYFPYSAPDRNGGGSHPDVSGHKRHGQELADFIRTIW